MVGRSYNKVIATIESCTTKEHLQGASRMVKNFKNMFGLVGYPKLLSYSLEYELKKKLKNLWKGY